MLVKTVTRKTIFMTLFLFSSHLGIYFYYITVFYKHILYNCCFSCSSVTITWAIMLYAATSMRCSCPSWNSLCASDLPMTWFQFFPVILFSYFIKLVQYHLSDSASFSAFCWSCLWPYFSYLSSKCASRVQ